MNTITYASLRQLYAHECKFCAGVKSITDADGIRRECTCQKLARQKWRLEQVKIRPDSLKYKGWSDFNGTIEDNGQIIGNLVLESAVDGRNKAFRYCYGIPYTTGKLPIHVHKHVSDGQNVIITGDNGSGRSLLAVLILKEVIRASSLLTDALEYRWIETFDLIDAARWTINGSADKGVDHDYLDHVSGLDFLFLEGVGLQTRGHNYPPDHFALDKLFGYRRSMRLPTIMTCSKDLWKLLTGRNPRGREEVQKIYGNQFLEMLLDSNNVMIELEKDGE